MRIDSRMRYVVWEDIDGSAYVIVLHGEGNQEKVTGFRNKAEANGWVERRLRISRIEELENKVLGTPWLVSKTDATV